MTLTQLIETLKAIKKEHGDLEVGRWDSASKEVLILLKGDIKVPAMTYIVDKNGKAAKGFKEGKKAVLIGY